MNNPASSGAWALVAALVILLAPGAAYADGTQSFTLTSSPPGGKRRFESEHRPKPVRSYWLKGKNVSSAAEAYLLRADGAVEELSLAEDKGFKNLKVNMPMGDGPAHGANNIYVIDKNVVNDTLVVRTAKWTTIHHSCGWGHGYKYDEERLAPKNLSRAPLDIVCGALWNGSFHVTTNSGDNLACNVYSYGKPAAGAHISVVTEKGWKKEFQADETGAFSVRLIKDYYTSKWSEFDKRHTGKLFFSTEYELAENGELEGQKYDKVRMIATYPWRYSPSREDYTSYSHGLLIGSVFMIAPMVIVYAYRERRRKPFRETSFDE